MDSTLLDRALAHRSWCAEHAGNLSNERLEFLGDAVLGLVVAEYVFAAFPERSEGWLSRARASLVRGSTLYSIAQEIGVGDALFLGKGEQQSGGRDKPSILADSVEALIGATFVDAGIDEARRVVLGLLGTRLEVLAQQSDPADPSPNDHKSRLQEMQARQGLSLPTYTWSESGLEHARHFVVEARIDGVAVGRGTGTSKKQAEQDAAQHALSTMNGDQPSDEDADPAESELIQTFSTSEPE